VVTRPLPALLFLVGVALAAAWAFTFRPGFLGGPAGYVMVSGHSMEPTLYTGDLVVARNHAAYARGDIVAFRVEGGIVIHRIVGGDGVAGFDVQGDNKTAPDSWRPTNRDIVGKQWVHLPGKGRWLAWARAPQHLSAIAGGMAAMTLVGGQQATKKLRRKRGKHMRDNGQSGKRANGQGPGGLPGPTWAWTGMAAAAVIGVTFGLVAVKAFTTPATRTVQTERGRYVQSAAWDYTFLMQQSTLYPDGKVVVALPPLVVDPRLGPVTGRVEVPPVYTR
jgi:signal peptidase